MASTKYSVVIGFLLLTVLVGSYVMMTLGDSLRIKVEATQSTFQSYIDGSWQTAGIEKNALYNGSKLLVRNSSLGNISYILEQTTNKTTIIRKNTYNSIDKPTITDIYVFDGGTKAVELFPVSHKVIIENASGLTYQYQVTSLEYSGTTMTNIQSPQSFGKNMKIEWNQTPYYSQVFKYTSSNTGKLTLKYKINSSYAEYDVRLFDPVLPNLTIINTVNLAGNMSYDQLYVSSTGVINVNTTVGYLNITANNITILGQVNANGIGSAGASGACACDCSGGASSGSTGLGLGGGAAGGGASCYYCGGCASASDGGAATHTYGSATGFSAFMGSGGGSGGYGKAYYCSCSCDTVCSGSGGNGGGYLVLNGNVVNLQGATLSVNGAEGSGGGLNNYYFKFANGGAGSAGEILINGTTVNLNSATINTLGGTGASGGRTKVFYTSTLSKSGLTTNVGTSGTYYEELVNINITQNSPANLNYTQSNTNTYNCTFNSTTGTPIYNIALNIYNTSGVVFNYSYINTSGFSNKTVFVYNWSNYYINQSGKFNWSCSAVAKAYDAFSTCYQESANTTNQTSKDGSCGLLYTGGYYTPNATTAGYGIDKVNDGSNATTILFSTPGSTNFLYVNYTAPTSVSSGNYSVVYTINCGIGCRSNNTINISISSPYIISNKLQVRYSMLFDSGLNTVSFYNGTSWVDAQELGRIAALFEDAVYWNYPSNFNYSVPMEKGFEITQRIMYIDNYTFLANWSNTMVNNSWYNVNTTTNEVNISGVSSYINYFVLGNRTGTVNSTVYTDVSRIIYYNLSDQYYNLSVNVTSCPLCLYVGGFPSTTNLISYYKLDETGGSTAVDSMIYKNMTITGAIPNQPGKINTAYSFDGAGDYVQTATGGVSGNSARSISYWHKGTATGKTPASFGLTATNNYAWAIEHTNSTHMSILGRNAAYDEYNIPVSKTYLDGNWHFITVTWDGSTSIKIYIDGELAGTRTHGTPYQTSDGMVIGNWVNGDRSMNGYLDEVGFWNKELSNAEVLQLYNSGYGSSYGATSSARTYYQYLQGMLFNIDTIVPAVNWNTTTTALNRTANFSKQNWIYGKLDITELNLKNITFTVRNSTGIVNVTTYSF